MKQYSFDNVGTLQELVSDQFSEWSNELTITQEMIEQFADLSGEDYWLHTDPEKSKEQGPFGGTIAQGSLLLVLISKMTIPQDWEVIGFSNMLNYGINKLRFTGVVPTNSKIYSRRKIKAITQEMKAGKSRGTQFILEQEVCIVGQQRPALTCELVYRYM